MTDVVAKHEGVTPLPIPFATRRGVALAALAALSVLLTSTAGRLVSAPSVAGWYKTLAKPSFNPPNWVFPVAWSILFAMMGVAFWRILRLPPSARRTLASRIFLVQLVVNVGWSAAFFGAQSPLAGLIVIVPFWVLIAATARIFASLDRVAGLALVPYLAWVAFATLLNASIVALN